MQTVIGITGGTGCGKTTALQVLEALGVHVIDCDALYHQLLETNQDMVQAIARAFPDVVTDGQLQRKVLGQQVFGDPDALNRLNQIVWPFITDSVKITLADHAPNPCAIDAIGLAESGLAALCTHTVAITAPEEVRIARLMARENISEHYARCRIRAQKPNEAFAAVCGLTIENQDGSAADFMARCSTIFQTLLKEGPLK